MATTLEVQRDSESGRGIEFVLTVGEASVILSEAELRRALQHWCAEALAAFIAAARSEVSTRH